MLIEENTEFESRVPGSLAVHIFLELVIFMTKQISSKANLRVHYLMLKMLQKALYFDFPDFGLVTKFNPKMQDFKRVLDLTWNKGSDFFDSLSNIKNFKRLWKRDSKCDPNRSESHSNGHFFSKKSAKCDPNRTQMAIFFQKNHKKLPSGWGLRPHAPSVTCLSCTNLLTTSPDFDRIETFLSCCSSPSSIANPAYEPNQTPTF